MYELQKIVRKLAQDFAPVFGAQDFEPYINVDNAGETVGAVIPSGFYRVTDFYETKTLFINNGQNLPPDIAALTVAGTYIKNNTTIIITERGLEQ